VTSRAIAAPPATGGRDWARKARGLLELRAPLEFGAMLASLPLLRRAPRGDGHPVLLLPGFGAGDLSLEPLRAYLKQRGYAAETWGLGTNVGFQRRYTKVIEQKLRYMHHVHRRRVSVVGFSLGGVFAFYAAHVAPECVRLAITMGSPLRLDPDRPPPPAVRALYRALAMPHGPTLHQARSRTRALRTPPPVPSTCIYSESDGVVPPHQATLDGDPANHENLRVPGSHTGLAMNPVAMWIVADRLAQKEGRWKPFRAPDVLKRWTGPDASG
jgi:pimeloyl-ACP methyl ester carboxylesterase